MAERYLVREHDEKHYKPTMLEKHTKFTLHMEFASGHILAYDSDRPANVIFLTHDANSDGGMRTSTARELGMALVQLAGEVDALIRDKVVSEPASQDKPGET